LAGILYVVATPIGNMEDMTYRAKRTLTEVDLVAAEDTRTAMKLFTMLGIRNKLISNHKFNEKKQVDYLLSELLQGKDVAIVSDAGTPCISDPGAVIISHATNHGIQVIGVCGASAVITALSISGFHFTSFAFYGFFPRENKEVKETLQKIVEGHIVVSVFFISPKQIQKTLDIIRDTFPGADLCLCNDLTKRYEKIYRGTVAEVIEAVRNNPSAEKGEYTLVIQTRNKSEPSTNPDWSLEAMLIDHLVKNGGTIKDAIDAMQKLHKGKLSKKEFYAASLHLKTLLNAETSLGGKPC